MTTQTTQTTVVGTPTLPRVNLLPPEIAEARQLRTYRIGAGGAVAAAAVLVGVVYWHSHGGVASAQTQLDASTTRTAQLNTQLSSYQNVNAVKAEVASAQNTLTSALSGQVLWSRYLQDMSVSLAGNYWFATMVMATSSAGPVGATSTSTPFTDANAIGSITLTGTAVSHFDVADLLRDLAKEKGLSHPTLQSSSESATPVFDSHRLKQFTVTAPVDSNQKPVATTAATPATGTAANGQTPTTTPTKAAGN